MRLRLYLLTVLAAAVSGGTPIAADPPRWVDLQELDDSNLARKLRNELGEAEYNWLSEIDPGYILKISQIYCHDSRIHLTGELTIPAGKGPEQTVDVEDCRSEDSLEKALHYLLNQTLLYWSVSPFGYLRAPICIRSAGERTFEFSDLKPESSPDGFRLPQDGLLLSQPYYRLGFLKSPGGISTVKPTSIYLKSPGTAHVSESFTAKLEYKTGRPREIYKYCGSEKQRDRVLTLHARPARREVDLEEPAKLRQYRPSTSFGSEGEAREARR